MARYCFYCGRELTAGERCHCKDPSADTSSQSAQSAQSTQSSHSAQSSRSAQSKQSSRPKNSSEARDKATYSYQTAGSGAAAGFGSSAAGRRARTSTKTRHAGSSWDQKGSTAAQKFMDHASRIQKRLMRLSTFRDQVHTLFPNITSGMISGVQYVTRPASKIRQEALRVKRPFTYFKIAGFSLISGLLALLLSRSGATLFTAMISSVFGSSQTLLFSHPVSAYVGLSVFSFLFVMALGVSFYIASRFSNRKPSFRKIMDLTSISLVYLLIMEIFVMITVLFGSRGSLSLIFISLILMGVTHLLSFRNALGLSEDTVFFFLIFVYIFCYLLLKLLLSIAAQLLFLL